MERLTKIIEGVTVYIGPGNEFSNGLIPAELLDDQIRTVIQTLIPDPVLKASVIHPL